jgi:hypothetical protein
MTIKEKVSTMTTVNGQGNIKLKKIKKKQILIKRIKLNKT